MAANRGSGLCPHSPAMALAPRSTAPLTTRPAPQPVPRMTPNTVVKPAPAPSCASAIAHQTSFNQQVGKRLGFVASVYDEEGGESVPQIAGAKLRVTGPDGIAEYPMFDDGLHGGDVAALRRGHPATRQQRDLGPEGRDLDLGAAQVDAQAQGRGRHGDSL